MPLASNDVAATRLVLEVDDVRDTVERLSAAKVRVVGQTLGLPDDSSDAALLCDPDGHALLLRRRQH